MPDGTLAAVAGKDELGEISESEFRSFLRRDQYRPVIKRIELSGPFERQVLKSVDGCWEVLAPVRDLVGIVVRDAYVGIVTNGN